MNNSTEQFLLKLFLVSIIAVHGIIAVFSPGTFDSGDGIQHYLFSRYSWHHPELFLHHWGKPFFILVSSPLAQFGLKGAHFFNIFCAAGTAWFSYQAAKTLQIKNAVLIIPLISLAPIYFGVVQSGLTEPLFGLILMMGIYYFISGTGRGTYASGENIRDSIKDKNIRWPRLFFAAILISFLPYVRSEGFLILPLFAIILLVRKNLMYLPLLATGTIAYSIIGFYYYKDLLWIIHQNPYSGKSEIYGSGEIYHFLIRAEFIWGLSLSGLFAMGAWSAFKIISGRTIPLTIKSHFTKEYFILICGSFFIYFIAHTIFWWLGIFSSLGLIRVMAAVIPVSAIIALDGYNRLEEKFKNNYHKKIFIVTVFSSLIIICAIHNGTIPKLKKEDKVVKNATDWLKSSGHHNKKIYYLHPFVSVALDLDRFDRSTNGELWSLDPEKPEATMPPGSIMLWDAHFGPNEGRIKLEKLVNNPSLVLLNKFVPEKEFMVLGGRPFEVYVFERK